MKPLKLFIGMLFFFEGPTMALAAWVFSLAVFACGALIKMAIVNFG